MTPAHEAALAALRAVLDRFPHYRIGQAVMLATRQTDKTLLELSDAELETALRKMVADAGPAIRSEP